MNARFEKAALRFHRWLAEDALPLWRDAGRDPEGGFYESLRHDGSPVTGATKRLRVQARQAFSFARAEALGLLTSGREASDYAWGFMVDAGLEDEGEGKPAGFVHVLNADGTVRDTRRDTYDHAFVLLAAAERQRLYGPGCIGDIANLTWAFLDGIRQTSGGFAEGIPGALPRRQNPHMHLLESALVWRDLDDGRGRDEVSAIMALFRDRFWDARSIVLREFFTEDWSVDGATGDIIEPGHMAEWVWLLREEGSSDLETITAVYDASRRWGLHAELPLLGNRAHLSGGGPSKDCRLWPQAEHIRASLAMAHATGDEAHLDEASRLLETFQDHYLKDVAQGGWIDCIASDGTVQSELMPASLLYHVITLAEATLATAPLR